MSHTGCRAHRFLGPVGALFVCLALAGSAGGAVAGSAGGAVAAAKADAAGAETVRIEACGSLAVRSGETEPGRPTRLARQGLALGPGDKGLGCRFTVGGEPRGGAVLVEIRLTRPSLVGQGRAVDRWYVPARRGEPALAEHLFAGPEDALAGDWELAFYLDDRLAGERGFTLRAETVDAAAAAPVAAASPAPSPAPAPPQAAPDPTPATALAAAEPGAVAVPEPLPAAPGTATMVAPSPAPPAPLPDRAARAGAQAAAGPVKAKTPAAPSAAAAVKSPPSPARPGPARTVAVPPQASPGAKTVSPTGKPVAASPAPATSQAPSSGARPGGGHFALQTGVFSDQANAVSQASRLRERGMPACVAMEQGGSGARYRVLAGRCGDRRAALELRETVTAVVGPGAVVRQVDPDTAARLLCH